MKKYNEQATHQSELAAHYKAKYEKAMRALESLTPGGSEFVGDPDYCVAFVRRAMDSQMSGMKMWARRAHAAEIKLKENGIDSI